MHPFSGPGFQSNFLAIAVTVVAAVGYGADSAHASDPYTMYDAYIPTTNQYTTMSFQGGQTIGFTLYALQDVTFNSLGFFDANDNPSHYQYFTVADGIHDSYLIELRLTSTQELLASTTVTPDSPLGQNSSFRYAPIPATTIHAGQSFTVKAVLPVNMLDAWLLDTTNANQFGLMGPVNNAVVNASTAVVVPEPSTTACLLLALGNLAMFRHRRPAKAR